MTTYRCSGCQLEQTAINRLDGIAHTRTGGKPSRCPGRWWPVTEAAEGEPDSPRLAPVVELDIWRRRHPTRGPT